MIEQIITLYCPLQMVIVNDENDHKVNQLMLCQKEYCAIYDEAIKKCSLKTGRS